MALTLTDIRKSFGTHAAVDGVSAEIEDGEFFVVLGPSGCGKSTLLRLVAGLEHLDGGEIALGGRTMSSPQHHVPPEARDVGVVFQSYALWPHMDVLGNVAFPIESGGGSRRKSREDARAHLRTVALEDFAARRPAELSGGQRQRVALARCLAGGARTVLMDEPLANLDPHLRAAMEEEIAAFHRKARATTIYITHDQREAMALASRVAVMARGQFQQIATPRELYERPASAEVARFIGRSAILDTTVLSGSAALAGEYVAVGGDVTGPAQVVLRPGDVALGNGPLQGRLSRVFYRGGVWEGLAEVQGLAEPLPVASHVPLRDGETVPLGITGGWALRRDMPHSPAPSQAPGHHAGRQVTSQPVE